MKSKILFYIPLLILLFFIIISGCTNDSPTVTPISETVLFSDDFRYTFPGNKWTTSGIVHIDSTEGIPLPSLNCVNGSVNSVGTFSTSQDLTLDVAYRKVDTFSTNGVNIRMLDNGSQYVSISIFKNNINIYIPSTQVDQSFPFAIDTSYHTFTDKMTKDGNNKFYRDNVLFFTYVIPNTHLLSISLSSPNVAARFDNVVISTP